MAALGVVMHAALLCHAFGAEMDGRADAPPPSGISASNGETGGDPSGDEFTLPLLRGSADAVNAFSVGLFTRLAGGGEGNLVLSPYSLGSTLAMAAYGARGGTRREILDALALSPAHPFRYDDSVHAAFARLTLRLDASPEIFSVANLLAHDMKFTPAPEYVSGLKDLYWAAISPKDFSDSAGVTAEVNAWAAKKTGDGIQEIVSPGDIAADTRLLLLNAVAFAGEWTDAFPPENTRKGDFAAMDGPVEAEYMSRRVPLTVYPVHGGAPAGEAGEEKILASLAALPFSGGEWEMLLFSTESVADFLAELTPETLCAWLSGYDAAHAGEEEKGERQPILVELPKFAFSSEAEDLAATLESMGIVRAFDAAKADFSGLAGEDEPLALSLVRHKARIEVDESGARASAASVAAMGKGMPERFSLDRPFVFMIRHVSTGAVVMLGRVARPVEE